MMGRTILVTGATGFVGKALVSRLLKESTFRLRAALRSGKSDVAVALECVVVGDLALDTDWSKALDGVDAVIHLAARAHVMREATTDPLAEFRRVNVEGTLNLARQAASAGVRRFIFVSSIGVNGNRTTFEAFSEADQPNPREPYAVSKWEAEEGLKSLAAESGIEVAIIRPPLVYGPNAPGNFGRLYRLVQRGLPLPLGAISNRRSLVALDNLVDLIVTCINHPAAANQTFLVSDGEDLSTPDLIRRLARALDRPARLFLVPTAVLMVGGLLLGKREEAARLCGSLQVHITKARKALGWTPPVSVDEGLRRTAEHYLQQKR